MNFETFLVLLFFTAMIAASVALVYFSSKRTIHTTRQNYNYPYFVWHSYNLFHPFVEKYEFDANRGLRIYRGIFNQDIIEVPLDDGVKKRIIINPLYSTLYVESRFKSDDTFELENIPYKDAVRLY